MGDLDARVGRPRRAHEVSRRPALDAVEPPGQRRRAPTRPSDRPCRRSGRCRSGRATARARARREAGWRRCPSSSSVDVAGPALACPSDRRRAGDAARSCAQPTSKPGRGPGRRRRRAEAQGEESVALAGRRQREPGSATSARPPGRDRRQRQLAEPRRARRSSTSHVARSQRASRKSPAVLERPRRRAARRPRRRRRGPARRSACAPIAPGFGRAVGERDPVEHEGAVVGRVAEVAAVRVAHRAVGQPLLEAVVAPLPDEPALEPGCRLDRVPVLAERAMLLPIAWAYSHMISGCRCAGGPACATIAEIGGYIGQVTSLTRLVARPVEADRALVVQRPRGVGAPHPAGGRVLVRAVPDSLPSDHRMIDGWPTVAGHHPRDALDPLRPVAGVVAQLVDVGVRLDVGLVDHVQPDLVAKVEERLLVGVVRGPDRVDVEPLHQLDVGAHLVAADRAPCRRVEVVAVDAVDEHRLAVDQQLAVRGPRPAGSRSAARSAPRRPRRARRARPRAGTAPAPRRTTA